MELSEILNIPLGKYRIFGRDNFEDTYFLVKDCNNPDEAITLVKEKETENELYGDCKGNEISTTFYVINSKLEFLYGLPFREIRKELKRLEGDL